MELIETLLLRNLSSLTGGLVIGVSASAFLLFNGRVAGVSGIVGSLTDLKTWVEQWQITFTLGLLTGGVIAWSIDPSTLGIPPANRPLWLLALAGLLTGLGTGLARGCTSGHGICGLARRSPRSLTATLTFMITGMLTATLLSQILGES
jgi:uncharacterized membrane protein YedE/YeeE